ncbi:MAG: general secretion pathway protein GspB [Geobacteraceae bacterium]|jgi:general secretion pathway protein B
MSFILDALKKLEQEKAAQRSGDINISDEIIRENRRMKRKVKHTVPVTAVFIAFGVLLLLAVSGSFLWHKHDAKKQASVVAMTPGRISPEVVEDADSEEMALSGPAASPARPVAAMAIEASPRPVETEGRLQRERLTVERPENSDFKARSVESPLEDSGSKESGITVSGIAWQDAPVARRAVINGELLQEGAQVGGATVQEILPTKVRFSSGGRRFSVSISGPLVAK